MLRLLGGDETLANLAGDERLVLCHLDHPVGDLINAGIAHMYNQIVIFINQHRRNRGTEAHAVCRAVLSKLLRSDLDHVLPLGAGAAPVKRFELTRKLGFKPIAELTYDTMASAAFPLEVSASSKQRLS